MAHLHLFLDQTDPILPFLNLFAPVIALEANALEMNDPAASSGVSSSLLGRHSMLD